MVENLEFLGEGRHRRTYRHKNWVIKVPKGENGLYANRCEARKYREYFDKPDRDGIYYAACRLMKNGYLVMEYLDVVCTPNHTPSKYYNYSLPDWAYEVECCQVGFTRDNRLVAYDYPPI